MKALALCALVLCTSGLARADEDDDQVDDRPAVLAHRNNLSDRLAEVDEALDQALSRARGKPGLVQALRHAKAELQRAQEQLDNAPTPRDWWSAQQGPGPDDRGPGAYGQAPPPQLYPQPAPPTVVPISPPALAGLVQALSREPFPQNRLMVLGQAAGSQYFLVEQVRTLLQRFEFPQDRLKAVRLLKSHVLDPQNGYALYASFDFANDKAELQRILSQ